MSGLGLGVEEAATQIVCRDRYAELVSTLSIFCTSCERYATEVRNLQRTEIGELAEAFDVKKQVGSSTMAQKRNPVLSENLCGLARVARSFSIPTMENMVLWHERDLTNSSAERFILPHIFVLTDEILIKMETVFDGLMVYPEKMRSNLDSAKGIIMAEPVMIALATKGLGRQEAHEVVRKASMKADAEGLLFRDVLLKDKAVRSCMEPQGVGFHHGPEQLSRGGTGAHRPRGGEGQGAPSKEEEKVIALAGPFAKHYIPVDYTRVPTGS